MPQFIPGNELPARLKAEALRRYVHRFTGEHKPQWAREPRPDGSAYPVQFSDDADWLRNTRFPVTAKGDLAARPSYCQSSPTWPNNPELRKP